MDKWGYQNKLFDNGVQTLFTSRSYIPRSNGHVGLVSHVLTIDPGDKHVVPEVSHVRDSLCELENPGNGISSTRLPKACGRCYFEE